MPKTTLVHWASQNSLKRVHPALTTCSAQFQKWKSLLCPQDMHTSNGLISNSSWILVPGVLLSLLPPGVRRSNLARVDVSTTKISRKWKIRERSRRSCTGAEKVSLASASSALREAICASSTLIASRSSMSSISSNRIWAKHLQLPTRKKSGPCDTETKVL